MCSSRLCVICLGLFVLSLLQKTPKCNAQESTTHQLYDALNPNIGELKEDYDKQIFIPETNCSKDEMKEKRNYFIAKLFERYGNENGVLTHEGLDKILIHLGFRDEHGNHGEKDHDHVSDLKHADHDHLDEPKSIDGTTKDQTQYEHIGKRFSEALTSEHDNANKQQLTVESLLQQYGYSSNFTITPNQFISFCPGFLYMLFGLKHMDHEHETPEPMEASAQGYPSAAVWGFSCLSVIVISLVGFFGVAVIPIMQKVFYNHLLQFLVALAVGALSGDALLHLIPHAYQGGHDSHTGEGSHDSHDMSDHVTSVMKGLCGLGGIYFFFLIERLLTIHTQQRRKKNKGKSKYTTNKTVYSEEQNTSFINDTSNQRKDEPDCEDMVMGIHPGHKALRNFAEESHNKDCNKLSDVNDEEDHVNCNKSADQEEPQLVLSHSHGSHGHSHCHKVPKTISAIAWMVILGDGIHNFSDGLAIGAAFANSITGGLSTSIAVFCHELPHEIGDFAVLLRAGMTVKQALVYNCVSSVLAFIGMIIGVFIGNIHGASLWIFVAVAGMFLYIALVDMLPQVSDVDTKKGENPYCHLLLQICGMVLGGGIMLVIAIFEHDMMNMI